MLSTNGYERFVNICPYIFQLFLEAVVKDMIANVRN